MKIEKISKKEFMEGTTGGQLATANYYSKMKSTLQKEVEEVSQALEMYEKKTGIRFNEGSQTISWRETPTYLKRMTPKGESQLEKVRTKFYRYGENLYMAEHEEKSENPEDANIALIIYTAKNYLA